MTKNQAIYPLKAAGLGVSGLAAVNWYYSPDDALVWGGVMAAVLASAAALFIMARSSGDGMEIRIRNIRRALFGASLVLGTALAFGLTRELALIDANIAKRATGVIIGAILIVTGNYLPKNIRSLAAQKCNPARAITAERFSGLMLIIAGFSYGAIWLFAPLGPAQTFSFLVGAAVLALVTLTCFWATRGASSNNQLNNK